MHWTHYPSFLIGPESSVNFLKHWVPVTSTIAADYTIMMKKILRVMGNHVMWTRRMVTEGIISTSSRFVFLAVSEEAKTGVQLFFVVVAQWFGFFVISRIIKVLVRVISLNFRPRPIALISTLIIPDITKTSSDNCLIFNSWNRIN